MKPILKRHFKFCDLNLGKIFKLAQIFHPSLLPQPGRLMDAALDLNFDQGSMYSYSPDKIHASGRTLDELPKAPPKGRVSRARADSNPSSVLPYQPSQLFRHESDEISRLLKISFLGQFTIGKNHIHK